MITDYYGPMRCHRYPGMMQDLRDVANDLVSYFTIQGWEPPPKRQMAIF